MLANFLSGLRVLLIPLLFHFIAQGEAARLQTVLLLLFAAARSGRRSGRAALRPDLPFEHLTTIVAR
jgi:uncharacterized membrane protein